MKCTNCGFDAENNAICPICGTQLRGEPIVIPTISCDEANQAARINDTGAQSQNPYMQNAAPQSQNPYVQNAAPQSQNPYAQNAAPQSQNPYAQNAAPQYENPYSPANSGQYTNTYAQSGTQSESAPKPKRRTAPLVVVIVMACVAAAGIVLAIGSSIFYRTGFLESITKTAEEAVYDYDIEDDYYDDESFNMDKSSDYFYSIKEYSVAVPFEYAYGTICLKSVSLAEGASLSENLSTLVCEVEVTNSSDAEITLKPSDLDVYDDSDSNTRFITDSITTESGKDEITLQPGESSVYTCRLFGSSDANFFTLTVPLELTTEDYKNTEYPTRDIDVSYTVYTKDIESTAEEAASAEPTAEANTEPTDDSASGFSVSE